MKSTLLQAWFTLLFVTMVAASAVPPKTSWKQATRSSIVARGERNRRLAGIRRQANPSCRSYPTCSETARSGTNYCTLRHYDLRYIADIGGTQTYSNEQCIKACEAFSGCVAALWVPFRAGTVESSTTNCLFKGNDFTSESFSVDRNGNYILTLMGSCCDFESKFPSQGLPDACQDDGQRFAFPTCSGTQRTNSGSAVYRGVDLRSYADTANPGYPTDAPHGSGGSAAMRATTKSTCLAACDSFASECKAVRWRPSSANGNQNSCFFSDSRYTSAPLGGEGYRNASSSSGVDLLVRDSSCEAEAGRVPGLVSLYCCNDPVRSYPTCPSSTGDGSAFYPGYDNYLNDYEGYGPNKAKTAVSTSRADCNAKCFRDIGVACLGTTYTGGSGTNCYFKTAQVESSALANRNYGNGGGASYIGGCSQYSADLSSVDSICCNNN